MDVVIICVGFLYRYAQVYIGVHYPGDILGGAIFGCLLGYGAAYKANRLKTQRHHL